LYCNLAVQFFCKLAPLDQPRLHNGMHLHKIALTDPVVLHCPVQFLRKMAPPSNLYLHNDLHLREAPA
jgi:hypothetical protein